MFLSQCALLMLFLTDKLWLTLLGYHYLTPYYSYMPDYRKDHNGSRFVNVWIVRIDFVYLLLNHTLAWCECESFKGDEASQWKRPKFDPSPHQNPLTDLHKNWQTWLRPGWHPACKIFLVIGSGVSAPQIRDFAVPSGRLVSSFFGFFSKATAYTLERIFMQIRQKTSFRVRKCCLGGRWLYLIFGPSYSRKPAILGTNFDWTLFFFAAKTALT